jgi:hypothetical protein
MEMSDDDSVGCNGCGKQFVNDETYYLVTPGPEDSTSFKPFWLCSECGPSGVQSYDYYTKVVDGRTELVYQPLDYQIDGAVGGCEDFAEDHAEASSHATSYNLKHHCLVQVLHDKSIALELKKRLGEKFAEGELRCVIGFLPVEWWVVTVPMSEEEYINMRWSDLK